MTYCCLFQGKIEQSWLVETTHRLGTQAAVTRLCLYHLMLSGLLCDTSLSSMTHVLTFSPPRGRHDSGVRVGVCGWLEQEVGIAA